MRKAISLLLSVALFVTLWLPMSDTAFGESNGDMAVIDLRTEYTENPLGIDVTKPRLSWKLESGERGQYQTAYQIQVATSEKKLLDDTPDMWDTGKVESDQSVDIAYDGKPLESGKRYFWRVKVWDKHGNKPSEWSEPAWWEMGLLESADWSSSWISHPDTDPTLDDASWIWHAADDTPVGTVERYFRRTFRLPSDREVTFAKVMVTADNQVDLHVNGDKLVDTRQLPEHLTSGWMAGQLVDVIDKIRPGDNVLAAHVGNTGTAAGFILRLDVRFADGGRFVLTTDDEWRSSATSSDGWSTTEYDDDVWSRAKMLGKYGISPWDERVRVPRAPIYLRENFRVTKQVRRARLYSSALGVYKAFINGRAVSDDEMAPGWTDYNRKVPYQTYDVTELLQQGENGIGAIVAEGWYGGTLFGGHRYGDTLAFNAQLVVEYTDGSMEKVTTGDGWRVGYGAIQRSQIYDGELIDARKDQPGWNQAGFEGDWIPARVQTDVDPDLVAAQSPPLKVTQDLQPTSVEEISPGTYRFDFGQNFSGRVRLKATGPAGTRIELRHASRVNDDGTTYFGSLRNAAQADTFILRGTGQQEIFEPSFTTHGFRYVEVSGYPGKPELGDLVGRVITAITPSTGAFSTSDDGLNAIQETIEWGQRSNFTAVPTDTPQRDERLGWTGDMTGYAATATYNADVSNFLGKWLRDVHEAQEPDGAIPSVAPRAYNGANGGEGVSGWGDAIVTVPWTLYERYGDKDVLAEHYPAMEKWIAYLQEHSDGLLRPGTAYGDWLAVEASPKPVADTAYFGYSVSLMVKIARLLGRDDDAVRYEQLHVRISEAFTEAYVSDDGRIEGDTQAVYVLALQADLLPAALRTEAERHLLADIEAKDFHLSTGYMATPFLLDAVTRAGRLDVAYRIVQQETYPGWLYMLGQGATTWWERWNAVEPDGEIVGGSLNHYALGSVGDWMYRTVAGIAPDVDAPGYKHSIIHPRPGGGLTHAQGSLETPYGELSSRWRLTGNVFHLEVQVPVNTTATVYVPSDNKWAVTEGKGFAHAAEDIEFIGMEDGSAVYNVGSGNYHFVSDPLLGKLGDARDETEQFQDEVTNLANEGELKEGEANHLNTKSEELTEHITASISAYLGKEDDIIKQLHQGLNTTNQLQQWIQNQEDTGQISQNIAQQLKHRVSNVTEALSAVSTELLGIQAALNPSTDTVLPGDTFTVDAVLKNSGETNINDIHVALQQPKGWELEPVGPVDTGVLKPGDTFTATFELSVPQDQAPTETLGLVGNASYKKFGGTAEVLMATSVTVDSPITITSLKADPETIEPGEVTTLQATVQNKGQLPIKGRIKIDAPENWEIEPSGQEYSLAADEEKTVMLEARSSLNATEAGEKLQVVAMYNGHIGDKATTTVTFRFQNPPSDYYDHVDAGEPESEQAHNLKASSSSGTSVEGGLTRRYSRRVADAYFQYDMKVEPGEPFIIRAVETYGQAPQIKDYYVLVNGVKVRSHVYETKGGGGNYTYQFVVNDPSLSKDGIVTVRFQEDEEGRTGRYFDPSIADVWTMPYVDVDIPLSATGIKTLVERFEEEEAFANDDTVRSLKVHLTAVSRYEEKGSAEKVLKHMENFKLLLDHQQENELISKRAYQSLKANTDYLIKKWQ